MLPPYLLPITDTDLEILDALRLERFRSRFGQILLGANLFISGLDRTLIISGGHEIGALRYRQLDLLQQTRVVCGCTWVKVYISNELILNSDSSYNKLEEDVAGRLPPGFSVRNCTRGESMATAIQEQDILATEDVENGTAMGTLDTALAPHAGIIRSMSLADIAEDLEADAPSLQSFLEERNATLIDFGGTILVTETSARVAYEQYSLVRARQKMQERFAALNGNADIQEKPKKNLTTKENKPKRNYLTWKKEFKIVKSSYKKTLQNALNALFPDSESQQSQGLNDIIQQTDLGKGILDKITRDPAYTDKARARDQLLKVAAELASDNNQSSGEMKEDEATAEANS